MGPDLFVAALCFVRGRPFGGMCRFVNIFIDNFDVTKDFIN